MLTEYDTNVKKHSSH